MKKMTSLLLALFMLVTTCVGSFHPTLRTQAASEEPWKDWTLTETQTLGYSAKDEGSGYSGTPIAEYDPDQLIDVIIELSGETLLDVFNAEYADNGAEALRTFGAASTTQLAAFLASADAAAISDEMVMTQEQIKARIMDIDPTVELDNNFVIVVNAFNGRVRQGDIAQIEEIPGVEQIYLDQLYEIPVTELGDQSSLDTINMPAVWNESGYQGEGTIVSIIDSGVDYTHPLFADANISSPRLSVSDVADIVSAKGLAAGSASRLANAYKSSKVPYYYNYSQDYPYNDNTAESDNMPDSSGHGTHVAGIAAGGDASYYDADGSRLAGVAPEAQVLVMRVFPNAYDSVIIKAIQDSLTLGATSVNMSLGTTAGFTSQGGAFSYQEIFKNMRDAGILVAVAVGNENRVGEGGSVFGVDMPYASNPDWGLAGSPSTEVDVLSVASAENRENYTIPLTVTYGDESFTVSYTDSNNEYHVSGNYFHELLGGSTFSYVYCGLGYAEDFEGKDLTGKLALILRGELSFSDKVGNATAAGAAGVIVYSNTSAMGGMNLSDLAQTDYAPAVIISNADGLRILDIPSDTPVEIRIEEDQAWANNPLYDADKMSSFTSWGPSPDLTLKPEITAPGGNIYSSLPDGKYGLMSGTSMASPHVAGAMAVVSQYVADSDTFSSVPSAMKSKLMNQLLVSTAVPVENWEGALISPRRQGAGMMDVNAAVNTRVVVYNDYDDKVKYELGDSLGDQYGFNVIVENYGDTAKTYEITATAQTDAPILGEDIDESLRGLIYNTGEPLVFDGAVITVNNGTENVNLYGEHTGAVQITIPAGERVTVGIHIDLSQDSQLAWAKSCYDNGFFVEGFVCLRDVKDESPNLGLPYMGFYGSWLDAPFMDRGSYANLLEYENGTRELDEGAPFFPIVNGYPNGLLSATREGYGFPLGINYYSEDGAPSGSEYMAYPTSGNSLISLLYANMNLLRNMRSAKSEIVNDQEQLIWSNLYCNMGTIQKMEYLKKTYFHTGYNHFVNSPQIVPWNGLSYGTNKAEDGWYTYRVTGASDYKGLAFNTPWETRFYVDGTAPVVNESFVVNENDRWYWYVSVEEDHYLSFAEAYYNYEGGLQYSVAALIPDYRGTGAEQGDTVYLRFDITQTRSYIIANGGQFDLSNLRLYMIDYATNISDTANAGSFHGITADRETLFLDLQNNSTALVEILPRQTGETIPEDTTYTVGQLGGGVSSAPITVSMDGSTVTVEAQATGSADFRVTARTPDGGVYTVEISAIVTASPVGLRLNQAEHRFDLANPSESFHLTASFDPSIVYNGLVYECDNNAVVSLVKDADGMGAQITPLATGTATITVYAPHEPALTASCQITVTNSHTAAIHTLTFKLNGGKINGYSDDVVISVNTDTIGSKMPSTPYYAGYTFQGWYTESGVRFTTTTVITGDLILTAKWTAASSGPGPGPGSNDGPGPGPGSTTPPPTTTPTTPTTPETTPPPDICEEKETGVFGNVTLYTGSDFRYVPLHADGSYQPNAHAARADLAVMLYNLVKEEDKAAAQPSFTDVNENASYAQAIAYLTQKGVFTGYPDGSFRPDQTMTRAEFVTSLSRLGQLKPADIRFSDVGTGHWAYANIVNAYARGWVNGYTDGTFRPNNAITNAEAVKIINMLLGRKAEVPANPPVIPGLNPGFWGYDQIISALIY